VTDLLTTDHIAGCNWQLGPWSHRFSSINQSINRGFI